MEDSEANCWIEKHFKRDRAKGRKLAKKFARLAAKICGLNNDALKEFNRVSDNIGAFCGADITTKAGDGEDLTRN